MAEGESNSIGRGKGRVHGARLLSVESCDRGRSVLASLYSVRIAALVWRCKSLKDALANGTANDSHDWSDDYCIKILSALRPAMSPSSRILICDQVMNTTGGCDELEPAPAPLLANYGVYCRYSHQRDLAMMGIINGIERTPAQFKEIIEAAGLQMERIWECRSQVSIVEVRLPHANGTA